MDWLGEEDVQSFGPPFWTGASGLQIRFDETGESVYDPESYRHEVRLTCSLSRPSGLVCDYDPGWDLGTLVRKVTRYSRPWTRRPQLLVTEST